jgi:hypothetical protein
VFVRWVGSLVALAALFAFSGCGGGSSDGEHTKNSDLEGNWGGRLTQKDLPPFEMAVKFGAGSDTRVAYTGIECGGTWTGEGALLSNPPIYLFREQIDSGSGGACKGTGRVSLDPDKPCTGPKNEICHYTRFDYRFDGGGVSSKGALTRISDERLSHVFREAGVTPP